MARTVGGFCYIGLLDKNEVCNYGGQGGSTNPAGRTCAGWQWVSKPGAEVVPMTFFVSSAGQQLWGRYEPNNLGGEHAGAFYHGYGCSPSEQPGSTCVTALNDINARTLYPYICETLLDDYYAGDFVEYSFVSGRATTNLTITELPALAAVARRAPATIIVPIANVASAACDISGAWRASGDPNGKNPATFTVSPTGALSVTAFSPAVSGWSSATGFISLTTGAITLSFLGPTGVPLSTTPYTGQANFATCNSLTIAFPSDPAAVFTRHAYAPRCVWAQAAGGWYLKTGGNPTELPSPLQWAPSSDTVSGGDGTGTGHDKCCSANARDCYWFRSQADCLAFNPASCSACGAGSVTVGCPAWSPVVAPPAVNVAYGPSSAYLPCSLPPSRFTYSGTDALGRTFTSPAFQIQAPLITAAAPAAATLFVGSVGYTPAAARGVSAQVSLSWTADAISAGRPEFANLALSYACVVGGNATGPARSAGVVRTAPALQCDLTGDWLNEQKLVFPISHTVSGVSAPRGRYVRLYSSAGNYLQIAQLQVFDAFGRNVAQGKNASASSVWPIDGVSVLTPLDGVASTRAHPNEFHSYSTGDWWMVDLGATIEVASIVYFNRADCCQARSTGSRVQLLDANMGVVMERTLNGAPTETISFPAAGTLTGTTGAFLSLFPRALMRGFYSRGSAGSADSLYLEYGGVNYPATISKPACDTLQFANGAVWTRSAPANVAPVSASAAIAITPIAGCASNSYALSGRLVDCHADYPAVDFYTPSAPLTILPAPQTLIFNNPSRACSPLSWSPGKSPFSLSFTLVNNVPSSVVQVSVVGSAAPALLTCSATSTTCVLDADGNVNVDFNTLYPSFTAWTAATGGVSTAFFSLRVTAGGSSSAGAVTATSCGAVTVSAPPPTLRVAVTSLVENTTAFSDSALAVRWSTSTPSACGVRLVLSRSGRTQLTFPDANSDPLPSSVTAYSLSLPAGFFSLSTAPEWTVSVVTDTVGAFDCPTTSSRQNCGWTGITPGDCTARTALSYAADGRGSMPPTGAGGQCCYAPSSTTTAPWCFYKMGTASASCRAEGSRNATSSAFALRSAFDISSPTGGALLWPGKTLRVAYTAAYRGVQVPFSIVATAAGVPARTVVSSSYGAPGAASADCDLSGQWYSTASIPQTLNPLQIITVTQSGAALSASWAGDAPYSWTSATGDVSAAARTCSLRFTSTSGYNQFATGSFSAPSCNAISWSNGGAWSRIQKLSDSVVWTSGYVDWAVTSADVAALSGTSTAGRPWALASLTLTTAPMDGSVVQVRALPLPFPGTTSAPRVGLTAAQPVISVDPPSVNNTVYVGRAFDVSVRIRVPVAGAVQSVPSFGVLGLSSSATDGASVSLAAQVAAAPTQWYELPDSFAPVLGLTADISLAHPTLPSVTLFTGVAVHNAPTANANTADLTPGAPAVLTALVTNNTFGGCALRPDFFIRAVVYSGGAARDLLLPSPSAGVSASFNVLPPPAPVRLLEPTPPVGAPGILFSESTYTIKWEAPTDAGCGVRFDVILFKTTTVPAHGVTPGWGANAPAEILLSGVNGAAGSAVWNFTSADRTWWTDGSPYARSTFFVALVTPDSRRIVLSSQGPFVISRSTISVWYAHNGGMKRTLEGLSFGQPVTVVAAAVGFVGRPANFALVATAGDFAAELANAAPYTQPYYRTSRWLPGALVLNSTAAAALDANTPRSPLQTYTLTFNPRAAAVAALLASTPTASALRVVEVRSGVASSDGALAAYTTVTAQHAAAYAMWAAALSTFPGGYGPAPPAPASFTLSGFGSLSSSTGDIALPTVRVRLGSSVVTGGAAAGDAIPVSFTIAFIWSTGVTIASTAKLTRDGYPGEVALGGGCDSTFVNPANAPNMTVNALSCAVTLPTGTSALSALGGFGVGFRIRVIETLSGAASVSADSFSIFASTLKVSTPLPALLAGGAVFGPISFCLDKGASYAATNAIFSAALLTPSGAAWQFPGAVITSSPNNIPAGCAGSVYWTLAAVTLPNSLPTAHLVAPWLSFGVWPTDAVNSKAIRALSTGNFTFTDGTGVILTNLDALGTTYNVKDVVQGRKTVSAKVSLPDTLRSALAAQNADMRVQVHCPGFAKAGWGFVDPWWFAWNAWRDLRLGTRNTWAATYKTWNSFWTPWFYRPYTADYRCRTQGVGCSSWMTPKQQAEVQALFRDPDSINSEEVVVSVARVSWASGWVSEGTNARSSTTLNLDISGNWDKISFVDGACYLTTFTNSSSFVPMPAVASGRGFCAAGGGPCAAPTEWVEGVWGKNDDLYFKPMFSFPASAKPFPVQVRLPAENLGGKFLVSGDVARVNIDMTSAFPGTAAGPTSVDIELRADGFRGNSRVGSTIPLNLCQDQTCSQTYKAFPVDAMPQITRWRDRGADGRTYANWGESNRESTQFSLRVRDTNWRSSWVYGDSNAFAFCEWPDIDSVRFRRLFEYDPGNNGAQWLNGYTESYDPLRPLVAWRPFAALGDPQTVMLRQFVVNDRLRVRAFGIKCMNAVKFSLAAYDAVAGVTTDLAPLTCVSNWFYPYPATRASIPVDPYSATVNCDFFLPAAAGNARAGSALVIIARGDDGRGRELSQYFSANVVSLIATTSTATASVRASASATATPTSSPTASFTPSSTVSASGTGTPAPTGTPTGTVTSTGSGTGTVSFTGTPTMTPSMQGTGSDTSTGSGTPSTTVSASQSPSTTISLTGTDTASQTATPTSTVTQSPTSTPTLTATSSVTPTSSETPTGSGTATAPRSPSSTPSGSDTASPSPSRSSSPTSSPTGTDTPSSTPTGSDTPSGTDTPSPSTTGTGTGTSTLSTSQTPSNSPTVSDTPSTTNTATASGTPSNSGSDSLSNTPSTSSTASASVTNSPTPSQTGTGTDTPSTSFSNSPVPSVSGTPSGSSSNSETPSPSSTPSASGTPTVTPPPTPTTTVSVSGTAQPSATPSPVLIAPVCFGLNSPVGTDAWTVGQHVSISWWNAACPRLAGTSVTVSLMVENSVGGLSTVLDIGTDVPVNAGAVGGGATTAWQPDYALPLSLGNLVLNAAGDYDESFVVVITSNFDSSVYARAPANGGFKIKGEAPQTSLSVTILTPAATDTLYLGGSGTVTWSVSDVSALLALTGDASAASTITLGVCSATAGGGAPDFYPRATLGEGVSIAALNKAGVGSYSFGVPSTKPRSDFCIQITFSTCPLVLTSESFVLSSAPPPNPPPAVISVLSPAASSTCTLGLECGVSWSATGVSTSVVVQLVQTIGGVTTALWASGVIVTVSSSLGIASLTLPTTVSMYAPASLSVPFQFLVTDAAGMDLTTGDVVPGTAQGLSPDFTIVAPTPPSTLAPALSLTLPGIVDTWVVDRAVNASYTVAWSATDLPAGSTVTLLFNFRETSTAATTTSLAPVAWSTVILARRLPSVNGATNNATINVPQSIPLSSTGAVGGAAYLYTITVVSDADTSVTATGDAFSVVLTAGAPAPAPAPPAPSSSSAAACDLTGTWFMMWQPTVPAVIDPTAVATLTQASGGALTVRIRP